MNPRPALLAAACLLAAPLVLAGCEDASTHSATRQGDDPYTIVTTVGMIADITRAVAGDEAEVIGIIGEGIDPHLYKPTAEDVKRLHRADVVFYNGLMLEGKMSDTLVKVAGSSPKPVVAVTETLGAADGYVMTDTADHLDPHVWMDVQGWIRATRVVANTLKAYDPSRAEGYEQRAQAYIAELEKLDAYAKSAIATIPADQRVLVTAHDAFGYLGRAYGIEVRGIQGISTEAEAGTQDIETLVKLLYERKIPAVFAETSVADKNVKALAEGVEALARREGSDFRLKDDIGELYSDAMGPAGTYEGTYIGMIDHNVTTITRALGGDAPPGGMQGKLKRRQASAP